ncbi:MAG: DUF2157 domain-containing protein [Pseudomonadota bacterium]
MATLLEKQVEDWRKRGVIDDAVAQKLRDDLGASPGIVVERGGRFSLFKVLAGFAALAFIAGVLLFIAANWDAIPRLVKVAGIAVLIAVGFVGGALVRLRSPGGKASATFRRYAAFLEEALYAVGSAAYVGGVALVGQMYHLPGELDEAMFGFALGLVAAGLGVRSRIVTLGALVCVVWWYVNTPSPENVFSVSFLWFIGVVGVAFATAFLRDDKWLRRACYVAVGVGLLPLLVDVLDLIVDAYEAIPLVVRILFWHLILVGAAAALWAMRYKPEIIERPVVGRLGVAGWFIIGVGALAFLHGEMGDERILLILSIAYGIAFAVFTLFMHGADHRAVRYMAYVLFIAEVFILFGDTIIGMLNSSGVLFVVSGALAVLAFIFYRVEKRLNAAQAQGDADG